MVGWLFLSVLFLSALLCSGLWPAVSQAESFGQLGNAWGEKGTTPGKFNEPSLFGVDPVDGSVYAGDITAEKPTPLRYRLQKFSSSGQLEGIAEIQRWESDKSTSNKLFTLYGVAVDHDRGLVYLIQGCRVQVGTANCVVNTSAPLNSGKILVFRTAPEGGALVPAATPSIALPTGPDELYTPQTIVVDPSSGDLLILGKDTEKQTVVERVSPTGELLERFVDTEHKLGLPGAAKSLAVGPDGTAYTLTEDPRKLATAWELDPSLSQLQEVPGFAQAAKDEGWVSPLAALGDGALSGGPEIAISPDGSTLYWKERIGEEDVIRGYSLVQNATDVVFGAGKGRCVIRSRSAGVATSGDHLVIFDYGLGMPATVSTFGPGGTGCPAPIAKFSVNGLEEDGQTVGKGDVVNFDASPSEVLSEEPEFRELIWNFGDGQQQVVACPKGDDGGCEISADPTTSHTYITGGEFTVKLEIKLIHPPFGNPPAITHTVKVPQPFDLSVFKSGTGSGAVTSSPSGIDCGSACSAPFEAGTGVMLEATPDPDSTFEGWSGACTGSGACEVTMDEAKSVTAQFDSEGPPPSEFVLTVLTSGEGSGSVTSSPGGIDCGLDCTAEFGTGSTVTLAVEVGAGSTFGGWSGACSGTGSCEVTMDEAKTVGAEFEPGSGNAMLEVSKDGSGQGSVKSAQTGINCGSVCLGEFKLGSTVTLFPVASAGSAFDHWGGACASAGTALTCKLTMSDNREVSASFAALPAPPVVPPVVPSAAAGAATPAPEPPPKAKKPKPSAQQRALTRCRKLKNGKARSRCLRRARASKARGADVRGGGRR